MDGMDRRNGDRTDRKGRVDRHEGRGPGEVGGRTDRRAGARRAAGLWRVLLVTCVVTALTGLEAAEAYAEQVARGGAALAAEAGAGPAAKASDLDEAGVGKAKNGDEDLEKVRRRIAGLHDSAESATESYNAAEERAGKQRREVEGLTKKIGVLRSELAGYRKTAGALARAQYRGGGLPVEARLLLRRDPDSFLRDISLAHKGQQATKGLLTTLRHKESRLDRYAKDASAKWRRLEAERKRKGAAKKRIEGDLKEARKLRSRLAKSQLKRLRELEEAAARARQERWLESGVLDEIHGRASTAGKRAIAYATEQIGKEYEWGAEGPRTYDCSGLTMRAWQAAGWGIPRTSQEQWRQLPRVPIEKMRPGDLIIYKRDAGHVGMYVGDGEMINAPRTGRRIEITGAGSMPILGVVRPDK
jgi:cell wall-associated NlpC family hydrolase